MISALICIIQGQQSHQGPISEFRPLIVLSTQNLATEEVKLLGELDLAAIRAKSESACQFLIENEDYCAYDQDDVFGIQSLELSGHMMKLILDNLGKGLVFEFSDLSAEQRKQIQSIVGRFQPQLAQALSGDRSAQFELICENQLTLDMNGKSQRFSIGEIDKAQSPRPLHQQVPAPEPQQKWNGIKLLAGIHRNPCVFTFIGLPSRFDQTVETIARLTDQLSRIKANRSREVQELYGLVKQKLQNSPGFNYGPIGIGQNFSELDPSLKEKLLKDVATNYAFYGFKSEQDAIVALESAKVRSSRIAFGVQVSDGPNSFHSSMWTPG